MITLLSTSILGLIGRISLRTLHLTGWVGLGRCGLSVWRPLGGPAGRGSAGGDAGLPAMGGLRAGGTQALRTLQPRLD